MAIENNTIFHTMACSCGVNEMTLPGVPYDAKQQNDKAFMEQYVKDNVFKPLLKFIREVREIRLGMFGVIIFSDNEGSPRGKFWAKELAKWGKIVESEVIHNPSYQSGGTKIRLWQWYPSEETKALIETLGPNNAPVETGWYPHTDLFYSELKKKAVNLAAKYKAFPPVKGKVGVAK